MGGPPTLRASGEGRLLRRFLRGPQNDGNLVVYGANGASIEPPPRLRYSGLMGFEDLAKRMGARDGGGGSRTLDPDQLIAEAARVDRRRSRVSDLVLGPLLIMTGMSLVAVIVIAIAGREFGLGFIYSGLAAGLLVLGLKRTFRGVTGRGRSSATGHEDPAALLLRYNALTEKALDRAVKRIAPPEADLLLPELHGTRSGGARVRSKHVAILIVLAAIGAFTYLELRQRSVENAAAYRAASDREIHAYFEATVKPALASATGRPAKLVRPILPVVPPPVELERLGTPGPGRHGRAPGHVPLPVGLGRLGTKLDMHVYKRLEPGERTDRLTGAGSIAIVERLDPGFYVGSGIMASVSSSAVVTVFDVGSGRAIGKLVVELAQPPPAEATQQMIDDYIDQLAGTLAAHLHALPRDVGR